MTGHLHINGSQGEGGGQIVRSSLALVTGRPVTIDNIRAGRERPGLMRQHLAAVRAAAEIGGGTMIGAKLGSRSLRFEPQPVRAGEYRFSVGTAGSATLVLQTVLPALLLADGTSQLTLEGGTDNQWAPPFDFLQKAFLPLCDPTPRSGRTWPTSSCSPWASVRGSPVARAGRAEGHSARCHSLTTRRRTSRSCGSFWKSTFRPMRPKMARPVVSASVPADRITSGPPHPFFQERVPCHT